MKVTAVSLVVVTLALGGCYTKRETVVERTVPVPHKEVVVEHPAPVAGVPRGCSYAGRPYSDGALACQNDVQFRCVDGEWLGQNTRC